MNYILLLLIIVGFFWLANKWLHYLKTTRGTESYAKRKIFSYLFMGFMALISITSIFADALFEFLGLVKPAQFEWMAFGSFAILAYAGIRIIESGQKNSKKQKNNDGNSTTISNSENTVVVGDIKTKGDVYIGNSNTPPKKK